MLVGANLRKANLSKANLYSADLRSADLGGVDLNQAHLLDADLGWANISSEAELIQANLYKANLREANLRDVDLSDAELSEANLCGADLSEADLSGSHLYKANLREARLVEANIRGADLHFADLSGANLSGADLTSAVLDSADLSGADLSRADLQRTASLSTDLTGADLTGCHVYGASVWDVRLVRAKQQNLIITPWQEPEITVDNIEVAQFIYLMLNNQKIRDVIDAITSEAVLILGRFTDKRKAVLDALREELRKRDYLPILFDFSVPATRDITETVSLLARMARFVIADLTDPSGIPKELEAIIPHLAVPVQPLLEGSSRPYAMFKDYWKYDWVLPVHRYEGLELLLTTLGGSVIEPAEAKVNALAERRRLIEAELIKPQ